MSCEGRVCIPCLGAAFLFVLTAPSHFHCGNGAHDSTTHPRLGQYFTLQDCFSTSGIKAKRCMLSTDRRNTQRTAADITAKLSPLPHCCSLPSALLLGRARGDELLWDDESWVSCDWSVSGLLSCTSALWSLCLDTWTPSRVFSFSDLYYLEWDYPNCSLNFNILGRHL